MVIEAGQLPGARRRRAALHAGAALAVAVVIAVAVSARSAAARTAEDLEATKASLGEKKTEADRLASECGIEPFSDEGSLSRFPMKVGAYPTKQEMSCARKVGAVRADLIDLTTRVNRLGPEIGRTEERASSRTRWALIAAALYAAALAGLRWIGRRGSAPGRPAPGS